MIYLDTSVLVAAVTREVATDRVLNWLALQTPGELAISPWVKTEFSAALSIKLRIGSITPAERAAALAEFERMAASSLLLLPIDAPTFGSAARLADRHPLGLRAGDALHLALALAHGAALATLDRRLADAAVAIAAPLAQI